MANKGNFLSYAVLFLRCHWSIHICRNQPSLQIHHSLSSIIPAVNPNPITNALPRFQHSESNPMLFHCSLIDHCIVSHYLTVICIYQTHDTPQCFPSHLFPNVWHYKNDICNDNTSPQPATGNNANKRSQLQISMVSFVSNMFCSVYCVPTKSESVGIWV